MEVPDRTTVALRAIAHGGRAVGHPVEPAASDPAATWLVAGALPGETVVAEVERTRRRTVLARAVEVVEAAEGRRAPPCALAGVCGGCDWQHVDGDLQSRLRQRIVADALRTLAGIEPPVEPLEAPGAEALGYRRRVKMHYVREGEGLRLGFRRAGTHHLEDVRHCPVLVPVLDRAVQRVRDLAPLLPRQGNVLGLCVGGRAVLGLPGVRPGPELLEAARRLLDDGIAGIEFRGGRNRARVGKVRWIVDRDATGTGVRAGPFAFVQVNAAVNAALVTQVGALAGERGDVLELYAGAGNLTRAWGRRGRRGVAVEYDREAAASLAALVRAKRWPVAVRRGRAERVAAKLREAGRRFEVGIVDPPRAGLDAGLASDLGALIARTLVYVSCDPATFARDAARLAETGFVLRRVWVADMMPQTSHAELVGWFERKGEG